MLFINEKGVGAHERLQKWRRENPDGFLINVKSSNNAMLHSNHCPIHLGDSNWEEGRENWRTLGNKNKVCSNDKEELLQWAKSNLKGTLKDCKSCKP